MFALLKFETAKIDPGTAANGLVHSEICCATGMVYRIMGIRNIIIISRIGDIDGIIPGFWNIGQISGHCISLTFCCNSFGMPKLERVLPIKQKRILYPISGFFGGLPGACLQILGIC